jgi:hypothetical protein
MAELPTVYPSVYSYPTAMATPQTTWPPRIPILKYTDMFRMTIANTYDLRKGLALQDYLDKGYRYIRRREQQHFRDIVRTPTIGCVVELTVQQVPGSVPILSPRGRAIIKKVCYF